MSRHLPVLLMTRPAPESRAFAKSVRGDFELVISPLFRVETAAYLPKLPGKFGVIFTSANGVRAWMSLGGPVSSPCFAVGEATGREARAAGYTPEIAKGNADDLVAMIARTRPGIPLVHARGHHARGRVAERLSSAGIETHEAEIYDQHALPLSGEAQKVLNSDGPVIAPLFSPRSAALFSKQGEVHAPLAVVAMSEAVAGQIGPIAPRHVVIANHPCAESMRSAVERLLDADRWVERCGDAQ